ncbi:class I SAM-dependent methyltransferase [Oleispirillum naphthae]|uniref:class I SAM-dependent methyltransferase n=1 Tax=Oleispirillum naphthae TaxID=2838853 RepID=UPI003082438D
MTQDFWNTRYRAAGFAYGRTPNRFLAAHAHLLPPGGRVLLPAEGEGRNAVFLAKQGFAVTCFDQSEVGVEKAKALAAKNRVSIAALAADALAFDYPPGYYDAVALIFAHLPPRVRHHLHAKTVATLKPGGLVLLQAFCTEQLHYASGGPKDPTMLYSEATLRKDFAACAEILLLETVLETLDEGPSHQGEGAVISLIARK